MPAIEHYTGREQAYVKHYVLETYLTDLLFKVGSAYNEVVYVDGYAGPWKNAGDSFEDTSFGIALGKLREVRAKLAERHRNVRFRAILVESDPASFEQLKSVISLFPDVEITLISGRFLDNVERIRENLGNAFAFMFIDPCGWKIDTEKLGTLISRNNTEVVFNLMFDFVNRAVQIESVAKPISELFASEDWKDRIRSATPGPERKAAIFACFRDALMRCGRFPYCLEAEVMKATEDRLLYALVYATRHPAGVQVFRDAQVRAYRKQDEVRASAKFAKEEQRSNQAWLFSLAEHAGHPSESLLALEMKDARDTLLKLTPEFPRTGRFGDIATGTLLKHVVRRLDVGRAAADMKKEGKLVFPNWPDRKQVPDDSFIVYRAGGV